MKILTGQEDLLPQPQYEKLPDIDRMLPSQARAALEEYFFQCLVKSGLDYQAKPKYEFHDDRQVYALRGSFGYTLAEQAFDKADSRYDRTHPLSWDNEKQQAYRPGIGYSNQPWRSQESGTEAT